MNGTWEHQLGKMNKLVMTVVASIRHNKLTAYQASIVIKEVLGPKLELGFRHAEVPKQQVAQWDTYLSAALAKVLDMGGGGLHKSAIFTTLATSPLEDQQLVEEAFFLDRGSHQKLRAETLLREQTRKRPEGGDSHQSRGTGTVEPPREGPRYQGKRSQ